MATNPTVMDFPYPPNTPGSDFKNNGGKYLRNLSPANQAFLAELQQWVVADKIDLNELSRDILDESLLLLRYLRANNFNIKKTKKHMLTNIEWRRSQNIPELMTRTPEQILGCKLSDLMGALPHWHAGYDKTGRPVLFKQQGAFDMKLIKSLCGGNFDRMFKYHVWEQELMSRMCYEQSLRTRTIIETVVVVLDIKGMGISSISSDFRAMMNTIVKMDQDGYPETLGKILVLNAPSVFPMIWSMVKVMLDPITAAKVNVKGTEYKDLLVENVGAENLPSNYCGTMAPLTKDVHPYAEGMAVLSGSVAAGSPAPQVAVAVPEVATVQAELANCKVSADKAASAPEEESAPVDSVPDDYVPEGCAPAVEISSPVESAPVDSVPDDYVPEGCAPAVEISSPVESAPADSAPVESVAADTATSKTVFSCVESAASSETDETAAPTPVDTPADSPVPAAEAPSPIPA